MSLSDWLGLGVLLALVLALWYSTRVAERAAHVAEQVMEDYVDALDQLAAAGRMHDAMCDCGDFVGHSREFTGTEEA